MRRPARSGYCLELRHTCYQAIDFYIILHETLSLFREHQALFLSISLSRTLAVHRLAASNWAMGELHASLGPVGEVKNMVGGDGQEDSTAMFIIGSLPLKTTTLWCCNCSGMEEWKIWNRQCGQGPFFDALLRLIQLFVSVFLFSLQYQMLSSSRFCQKDQSGL